MKKLLVVTFALLFSGALFAQDSTQTSKPETFNYNWEGTDYTMQKYFIVFLKEGPTRDQDEQKAAQIQQEHLAYLGGLYEDGVIVLNGPTGGNDEIKGFTLYAVATLEEAVKLAEKDPAVKAGRLSVEAKPWWLAKGSVVK